MPNVCLGDRASTFDEQEANGSTQPGIQARLWSLLQHRMIDAQAWPRWSPDILNVSMLARRASLGLYILDDPSLNAITKPDLTNVEFDNVPEARDIMLDDILDFDDDFLDNGDAADGQCLQDLRMNGDFVIEDDRLDEDLFWAELDVDADEDPPIGTLSQDTLESSGNEERYEVQREREEDDESRHDDLFGDHFRVDTDNLPSLQASTEGIGRPESWEVGFDELPTCEVDVLLDDEESAALDDSTFESNLGDESYNKILHKPLDGIRDENHYDNESFGEIMMDSDAEKVRDPAMLV